jgi:hypothetical protein
MPGGGETTQETTVTPSPLEKERAETIRRISPFIETKLMEGLTGATTPQTRARAGFAGQEFRRQAGRVGIQPGSPILAEGVQQIGESATVPDDDILKTAISLFAGVPAPAGTTTTTAEESQGPLGVGTDIATIAFLMSKAGLFCHVAEVLYGIYHENTWYARFYCYKNDSWFIRLYGKYSKQWAKLIEDKPKVQKMIKPIWDYMAKKGKDIWLDKR